MAYLRELSLGKPQIYCDKLKWLKGEPEHTANGELEHQPNYSSIGLQPSPSTNSIPFHTFFTSLLSSLIVIEFLKRLGKQNFVSIAPPLHYTGLLTQNVGQDGRTGRVYIWQIMYHHCSSRSNFNLVSRIEDPDIWAKYDQAEVISDRAPSWESLAKEVKTRGLCTQELERVYCCEIEKCEEQQVDELIETAILDSYVPHEEPCDGPVVDYVSRSEVEKLVEESIKTAVEVALRRAVMGMMEAKIDHVFMVGYEE